MEINEKAIIIEQFSKQFTMGQVDREFFSDFVIYNDLGIPLSQAVVYDLATLNKEGTNVLNETWNELCEYLDLDPEADYVDFDEMLDLFEDSFEED